MCNLSDGIERQGIKMRMDNILFLSEDGTYTVIDYEFVDKEKEQIKYIDYVGRMMKLCHEK